MSSNSNHRPLIFGQYTLVTDDETNVEFVDDRRMIVTGTFVVRHKYKQCIASRWQHKKVLSRVLRVGVSMAQVESLYREECRE